MRPYRVLIADADRCLTEQYRAALASRGFTVAACNDALDCLDRLRGLRPDLLVLDADLPWGQGEGVLSLMREGDVPVAPAVVIGRGPDYRRRFPPGRYGEVSMLDKPVSPARLTVMVRCATRHASGGGGYR